MKTARLHDGTQVDIRFDSGMYRADINGIHYCAPDLVTLSDVIARFQSSILPPEVPQPVIPLSRLLFSQLRNGKLEEKQEARRRLFELLKNGDTSALQYIEKLPRKALSRDARYITTALGRHDFEDVTFADLSEHVPDLVLRNKLVEELESRFKVDVSS